MGVLLSILGLSLLTYGVIRGGKDGFGQVESWGTLVGAVVALSAIIGYERRIEFPSLDVKLFRNRAFSASVSMIGLAFFASMGALFFTPSICSRFAVSVRSRPARCSSRSPPHSWSSRRAAPRW